MSLQCSGLLKAPTQGRGNLLAEAHWEIPAAWKAVVHNERVSEWRVYADNEPVWKVMGVKR